MSDSVNVVSRLAALFFFIAVGAGGYAMMTHNNLKAAEARISAVENERSQLKNELVATEKNVLTSSSAAKTCAAEVQTFKSRAQSAEAALDDLKNKKPVLSPRKS